MRFRSTVLCLVSVMLAGLALAIMPVMEQVASASPQRGASGSMRRADRGAGAQRAGAEFGHPAAAQRAGAELGHPAAAQRAGAEFVHPAAADSGDGGVGLPSQTPGSPPASVLAGVPYMGWNTYYGVGGIFDERTIISVAHALIDRGLLQAGYRIVWLDFGWASGERDSRGDLIVNRHQWPHGLTWLTAWLHRRGLLAGIYTDAGASGCHGQGVGSLGHYQRDANAFAKWGFDAVKVDFCGAGQAGMSPIPAYRRFAKAVADNASHRSLLLNVCNFWVPGQIDGKRPSLADSSYANYRWAPRIAQSWRTDTDIGFTRDIQFKNVLRNLDRDADHPSAAHPGHWNDPDYLGPGLGMTASQSAAQFSMWAVVAAPLILGSDPRALSSKAIEMLRNRDVIAIDQDPLGIQGTAIQQNGSGQVWAKPLVGGDVAVALLNRGSKPLRIATTITRVGLSPAKAYMLQDLWAQTTKAATGAISARVAPQSVVLYRVTPAPAS